MKQKTRNIISVIITVLFLLIFGAQALALLLAFNPPKTLNLLLHGDSDSVIIMLFAILVGVVVLLISLALPVLQSMAAWFGRVPGLIISGIGLLLNGIYMFVVTLSMAIFSGSDGLTAMGAVCFFFASVLLCILSIPNFVYILVEMIAFKRMKSSRE